MQASRYSGAIQALVESGKFRLLRDLVLIEIIQEGEKKTKSGIIYDPGQDKDREIRLAENKLVFARVLAIGEGYSDPDDSMDCEVGDIIAIGRTSAHWFRSFGDLADYTPGDIGITKDAEVRFKFNGEEAYKAAFEAANRAAETERASL